MNYTTKKNMLFIKILGGVLLIKISALQALTLSNTDVYRCNGNIAEQIVITGNAVQLDLNGYTVAGILVTGNNAIIKNGFVQDLTALGLTQGIAVKSPSVNTTINKVSVIGYNQGIYLESTQRCLVQSCDLRSNAVGLQLVTTNNCIIADCTAYNSTSAGFVLQTSSVNAFADCKALVTTSTSNGFGFSSQQGSFNSFDNCIASGVASSSPSSVSRSAGFFFDREVASRITNASVSNVATTAGAGAYGILLNNPAGQQSSRCVVKDAVVYGVSTAASNGIGLEANCTTNFLSNNRFYNNNIDTGTGIVGSCLSVGPRSGAVVLDYYQAGTTATSFSLSSGTSFSFTGNAVPSPTGKIRRQGVSLTNFEIQHDGPDSGVYRITYYGYISKASGSAGTYTATIQVRINGVAKSEGLSAVNIQLPLSHQGGMCVAGEVLTSIAVGTSVVDVRATAANATFTVFDPNLIIERIK